jgi:PKD repeat protein
MMRKFSLLMMLLTVIVGSAMLMSTTLVDHQAYLCTSADIVTIDFSSQETGVVLLEQDANGLKLRMDLGSIEFIPVSTPEGTFILPRIPKFSRSNKIGEPNLPIASELLSIPFDCTLEATVIDSTSQTINLNAYNLHAPIMPVQPSLSKSDDPTTAPFEYDEALYSSSSMYSLPIVETEEMGIMRATRMGRVAFSPIEYYPVQNKINVYTSITVEISFNNPNWAKTNDWKKRYGSFLFDPVNTQILNYEEDDTEADLVKYPIKYLIISDRMFESQLQPFIAWKTKKGFNVVVGYTDVIGTTTTAIKNYIQGIYNAGTVSDPAPSFVLFVGDAQQIPTFSGSAGSHVTDLRYCEFTGDDFPEIYYGRFSAQNTTQLQPQIDKTLEYEQYQMSDPSYLSEVTLVSGVDSTYAATHGNGQLNYGTTYYFNAAHGISPNVWLYPASDGSGVDSDVIATINSGVGLYNYTAHCSHNGPGDPPFDQSDISSLTNTGKYLLGIGNCCLSNTFGTDYSTPCFGEAWLQAANKGGIGWIGGSNNTYWDEDYYWGVGNGPVVAAGPTYAQTGIGAYDGLFHDNGEPVTLHYTTNGAIIFAGNTAVSESTSSRKTYYWEIYHLMGDPSVMTYLGVPTTNTVSHPSTVTTSATTVTVSADAGSYVGITKGGVFHGAGYIGTSGSATIAITAFGSTGTADIVVTCQNKIPYVSTMTVSSGSLPPTADFSGTPVSGFAPLTVSFTDASSEGPTTWLWNFGDSGTSTLQNPSHTYTAPGTYTVSLTATNANGSDTATKTSYITVSAVQIPTADFTASATTIDAGQSVTFTDTTTGGPTSWSWTLNGGTPSTSTSQNPTVTYNTPGTYSVTLEATNSAGSDTETKTNYITVNTPSVTYCTASGNTQQDEWISGVEVGDLVNTSGASGYTDYTSQTANLEPGDVVSVTLNTGYTGTIYTENWRIYIDYNKNGDFTDSGEEVFSASGKTSVSGTFTVPSSQPAVNTRMRIVMNYNSSVTPCGTFQYGEVEDYTVNITAGVVNPPVAAFTASSTSITTGQSITFTDQSTNNPTSWSWTLTGGTPSSSTAQNPSVTYNTAGTYSVTLTATNSAGSDSETKTGYITVTDTPVTYCTSSGTNQNYEWIAGVTIGALSNTSGASGYTDFTAQSLTTTAGSTVNVTLVPGFAGSSYTEYWKIWIDLNGDGDFEDSGEEVFSGSGSGNVTGSFTIPSASGTTRMRVTMKYSSAPSSCGTFTYGEVEDYTIIIN